MGTSKKTTGIAGVLLAVVLVSHASSQPHQWLGGDGDWNNTALWNFSSYPGNLDDVDIESNDAADWYINIVPQSLTFGGPANPWQVTLNSLVIDARQVGQATVQQDAYVFGVDTGNGESVVSVGQLIVGQYGSGEYVLNGGHLQVTQRLAIAMSNPAQTVLDPARWATLRVAGGTLAFSNSTFPEVGGWRNGRVVQTGGYVDGMNLGGSGSQLTNNVMQIGMSTQYNGAYEGRYEMSGGRLDMTEIQIGDGGRGAFVHTGGEVNSYALIVGFRDTSFDNGQGSYAMSGPDALLHTAFGRAVQVTQIGQFQMDGGNWIGSGAGIAGNFAMTAGSIDFANNVGTGVNGSFRVAGTGTQTGGDIIAIGFDLDDDGNYDLDGGTLRSQVTLLAEGNSTIQAAGANRFNHSAGTHTTDGDLIVTGNYHLRGTGQVSVAGNAIISTDDGGFMNQTGGTASIDGEVLVGQMAGADAQWFFGGGSITTPLLVAGDEGKGTFNHNSATLNSVDEVVIGRAETGDGLYVMTGSSAGLTTMSTTVADAGQGAFRHFDGIHTTDTLTLGKQPGSNGTYEQSGGFVNVIGNTTTIVGAAGTGHYHQTGGTHSTFGLVVGSLSGSDGTYTYDGDDLNVIGDADVGLAGTGVFHQDVDGVSISDDLRLGRFAEGDGTYHLNVGDLSVDNLSVGIDGKGAFTAEDGTQLTITQTLNVATNPGSTGTLTVKDVTLTAEEVHIAGKAIFGPSSVSAVDAQITGTLTLDGDEPTGDRRGLLELDYGRLDSATVVIGDANWGRLENLFATHVATGPVTLGKSAGSFGRYQLSFGSLVTPGTTVGDQGAGYFNHFGTHTVNGTLGIGTAGTYDALAGQVDATTIDNHGTYIAAGDHAIQADAFNNVGTLNYQGSTTVGTEIYAYAALDAPLNNTGVVNVTGEDGATIAGAVTNHGTFNVIDTHVKFDQPFVNHGAYMSDPSTNTFTDLTVNGGGHLVGGVGDVFEIAGDLHNYSTDTAMWDTIDATLRFVAGEHNWTVAAADLGPTYAGYDDNFAWGTLRLFSGAQLALADAAGGDRAAVYVQSLDLVEGLSQLAAITTGITIYYDPLQPDNAYLQGQTWPLAGGGAVEPVPEPTTAALVAIGFCLACRSRRSCA